MPQQAIRSKQNPKIKNLIKLQEHSKARREQGNLVLHGLLEVLSAAKAGIEFSQVYLCESLFANGKAADIHTWLNSIEQEKPPPERYDLDESLFAKLAPRRKLEGLIAIGKRPTATLKDIPTQPETLLMVADRIEKPANMGALARVAEAVGAKGLLALEPTADPFAPHAIHNSRALNLQLPCVELSAETFLHHAKANKIHTIALHPSARLPYTSFRPKGPLALIVGSEHKGLSSSMLQAADTQLCIPMHGTADSLNLAAAAAIVAFDLQHRREL